MAHVVLDRHGTYVHTSTPKGYVHSAAAILFWITLVVLACWIGAVDGRKHKRPESCAKSDDEKATSTSFLWRIANEPPSYFFGTIHVPYSRVWDYVPVNVKRAFDASDAVFFELDLTDPNTISALTSCQLLPAGQSLVDVLPPDLYIRLKRHLDYVKAEMPRWMSTDQRGRGLYADYLFNAITGNWERKRPIWVMLMVNSLTESDVKSRGIPVLDLYLAQEAERRNKRMGAVERVEEQCLPLNGLNFSQVVFALNQTLHHQELLRAGDHSTPYTTDDLIKHYNCGDLDAVIFSHDTAQVPTMTNVTPAPYEQFMAKKIDDYFRQELILKRNLRMGQRVLELLTAHPDKSFFFAFGAGHFLGNYTVLDVVQAGGYLVEQLPNDQKLPKHRKRPTSSSNNKTPRPAIPLVPEPSTLRDFSTRLRSNKVDNGEGSAPRYISEMWTARPAVSSQIKKTTFRPPTLLKTSPDLLAAVKEADPYSSSSGRYRNFNDLWVRLENVGPSHLSLHPIATTTTQDRNPAQMEDSAIRIRNGPRSSSRAPDLFPWSRWMIILLSLFVTSRGFGQEKG